MGSAEVIRRTLAPDRPVTVPESFTRVSQPLVNGLPQTVDLDAELSLIVAVPSGEAIRWRDDEPTGVVSDSDPELAPAAGVSGTPVGAVSRLPARALVRHGGEIVGSVPLVAGSRRVVPDEGDDDRGARIELLMLGWDIRTGSMRGPGDAGSRIEFAWRRVDTASERFSPPAINPRAAAHLAPEFRTQSRLGAGDQDQDPAGGP
jgi:hypothetical protein